jgi:hypothetical protein
MSDYLKNLPDEHKKLVSSVVNHASTGGPVAEPGNVHFVTSSNIKSSFKKVGHKLKPEHQETMKKIIGNLKEDVDLQETKNLHVTKSKNGYFKVIKPHKETNSEIGDTIHRKAFDGAGARNGADKNDELTYAGHKVIVHKLKEETMVNKTRQIVDSLYEGNNDIRDTVDEIISEKAVSFLEALKIEVAHNIFNEGKTYKDRHDKDYGADNKGKKKDDEYRNQRRKEKGKELEEEPLQELSKKKLGQYVNKASGNAIRNSDEVGYRAASYKNTYNRDAIKRNDDAHDRANRKVKKRILGIGKAVQKLTKEEHSDEAEDKSLVKKMVKKDCLQQEEPLNELSTKTLKSYRRKGENDSLYHELQSDAPYKKRDQREKGMKLAASKIRRKAHELKH